MSLLPSVFRCRACGEQFKLLTKLTLHQRTCEKFNTAEPLVDWKLTEDDKKLLRTNRIDPEQ